MMNVCASSSLAAFETSSLFVERSKSHTRATSTLLEGADYQAVASFLLVVVKAEISILADYLGREKIEHASSALGYASTRVR